MTARLWHVAELDGVSLLRSLGVHAERWEDAISAAWRTWGLDHDLERAGIETREQGVLVFIRGSAARYRIQTDEQLEEVRKSVPPPPAKRLPPRPQSRPPPAPTPQPDPVHKPMPKPAESSPRGLPSRGLFRKRSASSPTLEDAPAPVAPAAEAEPPARAEALAIPHTPPQLPTSPPVPRDLLPPEPAQDAELDDLASEAALEAFAAQVSSERPKRKVPMRTLQRLLAGAVQLYTHAQDPKSGAPVIYRRHGYALPMGTEGYEAEAFAREMLLLMKEQIPRGRAPRLFHIAVYDEMFTGEPEILALCKLEWKEWKDEINVSFPREGDDSVLTDAPRARTPSMHPADYTTPLQPIAAKDAARVAALFLPSASTPPKRDDE